MNSDDPARLERERGRESEERFALLLADRSKVPDWIDRVEPAKEKGELGEDVDFIVHVREGARLSVNVKSSYGGKRDFLRKHKSSDVCVVFVEKSLGDDEMRMRIISILAKWKARSPR